MGFDINQLRTNSSKEVEGVWVDFETPQGNWRMKVARLGNPRYQAELDKHMRANRLSMKVGGLQPSDLAKATRKAMAKGVLLDWEGLQESDGSPIPYSVEKAEELLEISDFADIVTAYSRDIELFKGEEEDTVAKN